jgi:hypothetical protein
MDFEEVRWESISAPRGEHAQGADGLYTPKPKNCPKLYRDVMSPAQNPPWHSPSPQMEVQQVLDLQLCLLHEEKLTARWGECKLLWMCLLLRGPLLVRSRSEDGPLNAWYFCLGELAGRGAVAWPALEVSTGLYKGYMVKASASMEDVQWIFTHDIKELEVMSYEWRCPAYAHHAGLQCPGAVAVPVHAGPVLEVAARHAFWNLQVTALRQIGALDSINVDLKGKQLFEVLHCLVRKILPDLPELDVLAILRQRVDKKELFEDLVEDDDVEEFLAETPEDKKDLQVHRARRQSLKVVAEDFQKSLRKRIVNAKAARDKERASSTGKVGKKRKKAPDSADDAGSKLRLPTKPPEVSSDTTPEHLSAWLPSADTRLSRDEFGGRWMWFHNKKYMGSCSYIKWGGIDKAAEQILHKVWEHHVETGGGAPPFPLAGTSGSTGGSGSASA